MITQLRQTMPKALVAASLVVGLAMTSACSSSDPAPTSTSSSTKSPSDRADDSKSDEALRSYVKASRSAVKREVARYDDIYSDFTFEAEGAHTIVYTYTYREHVDTDQAADALEGSRKALESTTEAIYAEMKAAGVTNPSIKWVYLNDDGSHIKTFTFSE